MHVVQAILTVSDAFMLSAPFLCQSEFFERAASGLTRREYLLGLVSVGELVLTWRLRLTAANQGDRHLLLLEAACHCAPPHTGSLATDLRSSWCHVLREGGT